MSEEQTPKRHIKSFVRRKGKMSKGQQIAYEEHFDKYCIEFNPKMELTKLPGLGNFPVVVEIGFGMGDATVGIAQARPDTMFIGIEVHKPGIGRLLHAITEYGLDNIRIIPHDAVDVFTHMIAPGSLQGIHVFFPDPWPKKRHHKRRLLQPEFISLLGSRLQSDGYMYAVTDWREYAEEILNNFNASELFTNPHGGYCPPMPWRPKTKFEEKGLSKDHGIFEIYCVKESI